MSRCAIFTRYGKGPQCSKAAAEGLDVCRTHLFLEKKLGTLPRAPVEVVAAPAVEAVTAQAEPATEISTTIPKVNPAKERAKARKLIRKAREAGSK